MSASDTGRVLITGANGRTSRHVLRALLDQSNPPPLRLLVHCPTSIDKLKQDFPSLIVSDSGSPHAHEFAVADYLVASELRPALTGVHTVFYNGPAFSAQETAMGIAMIDMAKEVGVRHFVFCSVLHPLRSKMLNHKAKLPIEEYLIESNLPYTILQPTHMMQNIALPMIVRTRTLSVPYSTTTLQGFLDLADLAAVARLVISEPHEHIRARYELVGENRRYVEVAEVIARALKDRNAGAEGGGEGDGNAEIKCVQVPRADVLEKAPYKTDYGRDGFERMLFYYDHWGLTGSPNVLRWLLGREPTTWEGYLERELPLIKLD